MNKKQMEERIEQLEKQLKELKDDLIVSKSAERDVYACNQPLL